MELRNKFQVMLRGIILATTLTVFDVSAQSTDIKNRITPETAEQFLALPESSQVALARQYGLGLSQIRKAATTVIQEASVDDSAEMGSEALVGQPVNVREVIGGGRPDFTSQTTSGEVTNILESGDNVTSPEELNDPSAEETLPRFGLSLFNPETSVYLQQADNFFVPDDYRLGVGDEITVRFIGGGETQVTGEIDRDGQFFLPNIGPISFIGLTLEDARALLDQNVAKLTIGDRAILSLTKLRSINVVIAGEVNLPGAYVFTGATSVMQALFQSGGITDIGSLRGVRVSRGGKLLAVIDLYDLLLRGDSSADLRLRSGDVIFIPPLENEVVVEGAVRRAMRYEFREGQTISDGLAMAGGLVAQADPSKVVLTRFGVAGEGANSQQLNLNDNALSASPLRNGDKIFVREVSDFIKNTVELVGAVRRPGEFAFAPGMRVTDLLSDFQSDFIDNADDAYALIVSPSVGSSNIKVKSFSPKDAINNVGSSYDPQLVSGDRVLVFSRHFGIEDTAMLELDPNSRALLLSPVIERLKIQPYESDEVRIVSISGDVNVPGEYPLEPNMTVDTLLKAASGVRQSAFLDEVELRSTDVLGGIQSYRYNSISLRDGASMSRVLVPRDHLTVRSIPDWRPDNYVTIAGEVKFPGRYLISSGEALSDVVRRAGGVLPSGFLRGAILKRQSVVEAESDQISDLTQTIRKNFASSLLTEEESSVALSDINELGVLFESFEPSGRIVIDLEGALSGDATADLTVEPDDHLIIPRTPFTVTVVGEVRRPGTQTFSEYYSLEDYLELSAGFTARADKQGVFIVRADGAVDVVSEQSWFRFGQPVGKLLPGDTLVVPVNYEFKESLATWKDVTQILYQGMVTLATVARL